MRDAAPSTSRGALEHSIYLSLLASSPDPQKVINSLEDKYLATLERIVEAADEDSADLLAALSAQLPTRDDLLWVSTLRQIGQQMRAQPAQWGM
jgi:hypothetical protein